MTHYILDENNNPVPEDDFGVWGKFVETNRQVAHTSCGSITISTIFLGRDQCFARIGAPVLWETMVFIGGDIVEVERYTSAKEAIESHKNLVVKYLSGTPDDID